jgi:hypothetical protein
MKAFMIRHIFLTEENKLKSSPMTVEKANHFIVKNLNNNTLITSIF